MKAILAWILAASCLIAAAGYAEEVTENALRTGTERTSKQRNETNAKTDTSGFIGEDAAKASVLEHSGLTEAEITYIKCKLDADDGRWVYDIEFYAENMEYDYEIDANTGDVISYDYDIEDYALASTEIVSSSDGAYIGLGKAKSIALRKVNLTEDQVRYTEASFERDDGIAIYQIEFVSGAMEYEFEINAATGMITEQDVEPLDN